LTPVADTNVVAALFLPSPHKATVLALIRRDRDWHLPPLWQSEFRHVLLNYVRAGMLADAIDDIATFHAEGVKEFEPHLYQVVDDYITACERLGGEPEKPASGNLVLRIDPNLHATALTISHRQGLGLN
jgi:predicted nucleic acid-binding protein